MELARQTHVKVQGIGALTRVTRRSDGAVVGGMAVAIAIGPRQQIKGMHAVVANDRRELKPGQHGILPGGVQNAGKHYLVPLVEVRKRAFPGQVGLVSRSKVTVEIARRVECLAEGVVSKQGEVTAKALLYFQDGPFVKSGCLVGILVSLENQR